MDKNINVRNIFYDNLNKYIFRRSETNPNEYSIWEEGQFGDKYKVAIYFRDKDLIVFSPMELSWEDVQTIMFSTKLLRGQI